MFRWLMFAFVMLTAMCGLAVKVEWEQDMYAVSEAKVITAFHGEDLRLVIWPTKNGGKCSHNGSTAKLWYQTAEMGEAWLSTNVALKAKSVNQSTVNFFEANWPKGLEGSADRIRCFVRWTSGGENYGSANNEGEGEISYRLNFILRFLGSPGESPTELQIPRRVLDFTTTEIRNAPFWTKTEADEKFLQVSQYQDHVSEIVTQVVEIADASYATTGKAEELEGRIEELETNGLGGCDANAVQGLIVNNVTTNYLATKTDVEGRLPAVKNGDGDYVVEDAILSYLFVGEAGAGVQGMWNESQKVLTLTDGDGNEADLRTDDGDVITAGTLATRTYTKAQVNANFATVQTVTNWANYWQGDQVRITVTNYYGNTSGELPRLRIEEKTNSAWRIVWDEETRLTNSERRVTEAVNARTNELLLTVSQRVTQGIASKAPRAWGEVTSAGAAAPPNTVWHTAPQTVFAGGMEYKKIEIGSGGIFVLTSRGQPVYTQGSEGQFRLIDDAGQNYFGFDIRSSYTLGCRTDSITVDEVAGDKIVTLTYDVTSATNPQILTCTNLTDLTWTAANVSWDQNPPTGQKIAYINAGANPSGYYKAEFQYAAGSKFVTNMQADLAGGIAASNETLNVVQSVYPVIVGTNVIWRIKNVDNP